MKKAIMYGAGNIGRGFIGQIFYKSGYEVCFVDVVASVVEQINRDRCYPVRIVSNDGQTEEMVRNVRAVNGLDAEAVAREVAAADIMATAVGVSALPTIIGPVCEGLKKRFDAGGAPLNIIICENLIDADKYLRGLMENYLGADYKEALGSKLGLVDASIGRMVPVMTEEMKEGNLLRVWVEPYCELPVDKTAFVGGIPAITGMVPFSPFGYHIKRKLFIHNMSHAMLAYLGWQKGYTYLHECVADTDIRGLTLAAVAAVAEALHREYGASVDMLRMYTQDIIARFGNRALGDTVARVGRNPLRKLSRNDRLLGAAIYCEEQGVDPAPIMLGIVAGLRYDNAEDEAATAMQTTIQSHGIEFFLECESGLEKEKPIYRQIVSQYLLS